MFQTLEKYITRPCQAFWQQLSTRERRCGRESSEMLLSSARRCCYYVSKLTQMSGTSEPQRMEKQLFSSHFPRRDKRLQHSYFGHYREEVKRIGQKETASPCSSQHIHLWQHQHRGQDLTPLVLQTKLYYRLGVTRGLIHVTSEGLQRKRSTSNPGCV